MDDDDADYMQGSDDEVHSYSNYFECSRLITAILLRTMVSITLITTTQMSPAV